MTEKRLPDAQLWIDLNREYPPDGSNALPETGVVVPAEPPSVPPRASKSHPLCYSCGLSLAGNDHAGKFSAYCPDCQPTASSRAFGSNACECAGCGMAFGGITLFDRHRTGPLSRRRCRAPERMELVKTPNGVWRTPEDARVSMSLVEKMNAAKAKR